MSIKWQIDMATIRKGSIVTLKNKAVSSKRSDKTTKSSFNTDTSSENDELELRANTSKERTNVGRDSKGIGTNMIINSNSRTSIRTGNDCINYDRGASRYGNNKEQEYREIKKKYVSPEKLDRKSTSYSSVDIDISSSVNDELEIRTTKSKEKTIAARHNERIETRKIKSSTSGKIIRDGKIIHKNMETTRNRDYFINGDRGASSSEINKKNHIVKLKGTP